MKICWLGRCFLSSLRSVRIKRVELRGNVRDFRRDKLRKLWGVRKVGFQCSWTMNLCWHLLNIFLDLNWCTVVFLFCRIMYTGMLCQRKMFRCLWPMGFEILFSLLTNKFLISNRILQLLSCSNLSNHTTVIWIVKLWCLLILFRHGEKSAGVISAVANNRKCGVGLAFNAKLGGTLCVGVDCSLSLVVLSWG